jgi:hypothetical protein
LSLICVGERLHRYRIPAGAPKNLVSDEDIDAIGPFVAPILHGGLGNNLFQLAAAHTLGKTVGRATLVGSVMLRAIERLPYLI